MQPAIRARDKITASPTQNNGVSCLVSRFDGVVPLTVEVGGRDVQRRHLGIGDLDAFVVGVLVEPALDGQALLGRGAGDQLDDDLMGQQRFATPVLRDEGEQAMLDAVPFAGAGGRCATVMDNPV